MVIGECIICGSKKSVTIHHLRDVHARNIKRRPKISGEVHLCRDCHDGIESMKKFVKLKQAYRRGKLDLLDELNFKKVNQIEVNKVQKYMNLTEKEKRKYKDYSP